MKMNTEIDFCGIKMKNPVTVASGTFGYGRGHSQFIDLNKIGAIITKGTSMKPKLGNKPPRICETTSGMLNCIGLENPGLDYFVQNDLPFLKRLDTPIIVNCFGGTEGTIDAYVEICEALNKLPVDGVEINLSCPNVKAGCLAYGTTYEGVKEITSACRKVLTSKPLIVKLTPNVTDITLPAKGAEDAGADAISLINTITGMKIDIEKRKPVLSINTGGLSGPAIKPVAVRMVYQASHAVKIPVMGLGGIMTGEDAIEFMMAGAKCVSVGSANLVDPSASIKIIDGIEDFMKKHNIDDINSIIDTVQMN
jgi:dihydroorotate dehydrogenase (NAD+) catalytic subunit